MRFLTGLLTSLAALFLQNGHRAPVLPAQSCPQFFAANRAPSRPPSASILCNFGYAVGLAPDGTPLWIAEHLTEEDLVLAAAHPGRDTFFPDPRLAIGKRAELADFRHSGWSRGHLTPSADLPAGPAHVQSYLLSNVVPQDSRLNSGHWDQIERAVRALATRDGELYIVTGPLYAAASPTIGPDHVRIPTMIWKALYDPAENALLVIACINTDAADCHTLPRANLVLATEVDPFPGLPAVNTLHDAADLSALAPP